MAFLHARGIVHGDLKPSNLLLRAPGDVVLADFGAAAQVHSETGVLRLGEAGGTPLYLAPEQFQGAPASAETNLYAAGAILWEAATGRPLRSHADLFQRGRPAEASTGARPADAPVALRTRVPESAEIIWALLHPIPTSRRRGLAWARPPSRY